MPAGLTPLPAEDNLPPPGPRALLLLLLALGAESAALVLLCSWKGIGEGEMEFGL